MRCRHRSWGICGFLIFLTLPTVAGAKEECQTDRGQSVSMSHGKTTANLTAWVTCKRPDAAIAVVKKRYQAGRVMEQESFYQNGNRFEKTFYWYTENGNSRRDQTWQEWYENGKLRESTQYDKGKEHGPYARYAEDGSLRERGHYEQGKKLASIAHNADGTIAMITCSENPAVAPISPYNALCGFTSTEPVTLYYQKGSRKSVVWFKNGKRIASESYHPNGTLIRSDKQALSDQVGLNVTYHDNGTKKQETRFNANQRYHGLQREYDQTGPLTREATFDDGLMTEEKLYYFNGQLKRHTKREQLGAEMRVTEQSFYDNGKLRRTGQYLERQKTRHFGFGRFWNYRELDAFGEHRVYRPDGTLSDLERYAAGKPDGLWTAYHPDGKAKHIEREYEQGHLHRKKEYDPSGRLLAHEEFFADGSSKRHTVAR